jgi:hypothetical protein
LFWTERRQNQADRNGAASFGAAACPPHAPLRPYKSASGKDRVARLGRINRPATTWRKR